VAWLAPLIIGLADEAVEEMRREEAARLEQLVIGRDSDLAWPGLDDPET
jgi:hypothetical protein